jgi:predicted phosphodiesterase
MKIGIVSDIHSEFWRQADLIKIGGKIKQNLSEADMILLAGDIGNGTQAIKIANYLWADKPVCMVAGNHEYYNHIVDDVIDDMTKTAAAMPNIHFLNRAVYTNTDFDKPVRVIGATLWTDYNLYGTQQLSMLHAAKNLYDFQCISKSIHRDIITPQDVLQWHIRDKEWIQQEMEKPFEGLTVVMTHHTPVSFGDHPTYMGGANSPAFLSNLDNMFTRNDLDLVVWGHTHWSIDKTIGNTRFISSQVGYLNTNYGSTQLVECDNYGTVIDV